MSPKDCVGGAAYGATPAMAFDGKDTTVSFLLEKFGSACGGTGQSACFSWWLVGMNVQDGILAVRTSLPGLRGFHPPRICGVKHVWFGSGRGAGINIQSLIHIHPLYIRLMSHRIHTLASDDQPTRKWLSVHRPKLVGNMEEFKNGDPDYTDRAYLRDRP